MYTLASFIAQDRLAALARRESLAAVMEGAVLFADITGYTALVRTVRAALKVGGAEAMTHLINTVFDKLIQQVESDGGVIVGFGGDALTCWFAEDRGLRAVACGLAIQQAMAGFTYAEIPAVGPIQVSIKITVATGRAQRYVVGLPTIQRLDVLAGEVMGRLANIQPCAESGQVIVAPDLAHALAGQIQVELCQQPQSGAMYARVQALAPISVSAAKPPNHPRQAPTIDDAQVRPWLLAPIYEWLANGQGQFLAEIRHVTVLFLRFTGLQYGQDAAVGEKLQAFFVFAQSTIQKHHGFVIKLTIDDKGSYAMCTFGAPTAHAEQMGLALAAALDLRANVEQFPFITGLQIGLAAGELLAGAFGNRTRAVYDLLGPAANLAARLMMQAQPGQILLTAEIATEMREVYQSRVLGPKVLKGSGEVALYELQRALPPAVPIFAQPLVGRRQEQQQLHQWQTAAVTGNGQTLRIEGPAGIGKSHLRNEFVNQCRKAGFAVQQGICDSSYRSTPYAPWQSILLGLLGLPTEEPAELAATANSATLPALIRAQFLAINPDWEARLPIFLDGLQLEAQESTKAESYSSLQRQEYFFATVLDLIRYRSQQQPLLLVLEDAHWIDEASLLLALAVSRVIGTLPVLLVLTQRPIEPEQDHQLLFGEFGAASNDVVLQLSELSPRAIRALAQQQLGKWSKGTLSRLLFSLLRALCQGNPFYTIALLDTLHEEQALHYLAEKQQWTLAESCIATLERGQCLQLDAKTNEWFVDPAAPLKELDWAIPSTLEETVQMRIDRLTAPQKLTLKVASVIGRVFESDILSKAQESQVDSREVEHHLDQLAQRNYIERHGVNQPPNYAFRHHILQEATYDSLLEEQKRTLHREVARSLEALRTKEVEQLAFHYSKTADKRKTLFYLDKAADKAQRAHANRTALSYYQQALTIAPNSKRRKGLIEVLHVLGRYEEERQQLEELVRAKGIPDHELTYLWGEYYYATTDYRKAEESFQKTLDTIEAQGELLLEIRCLNRLGLLAWKNGSHYEKAEQYYKQALAELAYWATYEMTEAETLIDSLSGLGKLYVQQGQFVAAEQCYQRALELSQQFNNRHFQALSFDNLGTVAYHQRQFKQAMDYYHASQRISRMIGDRVLEGYSLYHQTLILREMGNLKHCCESLIDTLHLYQMVNRHWEVVNITNELGILYFDLGQFDQAQQYLEQGLQLANKINDLEGRAYLLSNLALVQRDTGNLEAALASLKDGLTFMQAAENQQQTAFFYSYLATVYLQADQYQAAERHASQAVEIRRQHGLRPRMADDLATLASIHLRQANLDQAVTYATNIYEILEECHNIGVELPQRAWYICFQTFNAAGDMTHATTALQQAYKIVQSRAETIDEPDICFTYLTHVPINKAIIEAMAAFQNSRTEAEV